MRKCYVCGKSGSLDKHHIIHGHGKRKACQTKDSLIDICCSCHRLVHSCDGKSLDLFLKQQLQDIYINQGYSMGKVKTLMGGKLIGNVRSQLSE